MRVIDADALIDRLDERKKMEQGVRNIADILNIQAFIDSQPTAYDIDKVVEELGKLQTYNMSCVTLMSDLQRNGVCRHYICLEDAIKIVKQGGVGKESD